MIEERKRNSSAPCGYECKNNRGETSTEYPGVECSYNCKSCGWNPKEAKRRMETGRWVENDGVRTLLFNPFVLEG